MARQAVVAAPAEGSAPAEPAQKRNNPLWMILRMALMWYMFKLFFQGGNNKGNLPRDQLYAPKFERGLALDMSVYLSEDPIFRRVLCVSRR